MTADVSSELRELSSPSFAARASMASGQNVLTAIIRDDPSYRSLVEALRTEPSVSQDVLGSIVELSALEFDEAYRNPHDVVLGTMALALLDGGSPSSALAGELVASQRNVWRARTLGDLVVRASGSISTAFDAKSEAVWEPGTEGRLFDPSSSATSLDVAMTLIGPTSLPMIGVISAGSTPALTTTQTSGAEVDVYIVDEPLAYEKYAVEAAS